MRILIRAYDVHDPESGPSLHALQSCLIDGGHEVWATDDVLTLDKVRAWSPDVVVTRQWATDEASRWATALRIPLVMLVHGPGQFEYFMPQCDLVVFENDQLHRQATVALGRVPFFVLDQEEKAVDLATLIEQIADRGRRKSTLSLCMTVSNEGSTLEKAMESVSSFVDEIVIGLDTRSSDKTAAIVRASATDYFEYTESSPPDFPRMRNRAMERVTTDWALVLDGHEWVGHPELIRPALETTAWSIEVETLFEPDENRVPGLIFPFARIHRRHVRFCGAAAHEEIDTPLQRRDSCRDIQIWHERKPGRAAADRSHEKRSGELILLRSRWQEQGDRRALFYLANGLRENGEHEEAISYYREYLESPNFEEEGWQARLYLAHCYVAKRDLEQARVAFSECVMRYPERAEAAVGLGHVLLELGELRAAAAWFRHATAQPLPRHFRLFVEVSAYRWQGWHGVALALRAAGDLAGAAEAEQQALQAGAGFWAESNIALSKTNAARAAA